MFHCKCNSSRTFWKEHGLDLDVLCPDAICKEALAKTGLLKKSCSYAAKAFLTQMNSANWETKSKRKKKPSVLLTLISIWTNLASFQSLGIYFPLDFHTYEAGVCLCVYPLVYLSAKKPNPCHSSWSCAWGNCSDNRLHPSSSFSLYLVLIPFSSIKSLLFFLKFPVATCVFFCHKLPPVAGWAHPVLMQSKWKDIKEKQKSPDRILKRSKQILRSIHSSRTPCMLHLNVKIYLRTYTTHVCSKYWQLVTTQWMRLFTSHPRPATKSSYAWLPLSLAKMEHLSSCPSAM